MNKKEYNCKYCGKKMHKFDYETYKGYCGKCREEVRRGQSWEKRYHSVNGNNTTVVITDATSVDLKEYVNHTIRLWKNL